MPHSLSVNLVVPFRAHSALDWIPVNSGLYAFRLDYFARQRQWIETLMFVRSVCARSQRMQPLKPEYISTRICLDYFKVVLSDHRDGCWWFRLSSLLFWRDRKASRKLFRRLSRSEGQRRSAHFVCNIDCFWRTNFSHQSWIGLPGVRHFLDVGVVTIGLGRSKIITHCRLGCCAAWSHSPGRVWLAR